MNNRDVFERAMEDFEGSMLAPASCRSARVPLSLNPVTVLRLFWFLDLKLHRHPSNLLMSVRQRSKLHVTFMSVFRM